MASRKCIQKKDGKMTKRVDRFGNPIDVGTVIAYSGTNVGLIVGIVVKLNPRSYKVKGPDEKNWRGETVERYYTVLFDASPVILTAKGMNDFDPNSVLNEVEKRRLGLA
jgi:hypothetical protein